VTGNTAAAGIGAGKHIETEDAAPESDMATFELAVALAAERNVAVLAGKTAGSSGFVGSAESAVSFEPAGPVASAEAAGFAAEWRVVSAENVALAVAGEQLGF
jgi:hypothetical protein